MGVLDYVSLLAVNAPAWLFTTQFIIQFSDPLMHKSKVLALFVLYGPVLFSFLTGYEKMYLVQWFVNVGILQDRDDNMKNPRLAPMIRFAMLCKETYLTGNVMPKPISDGELDVIPRADRHSVRNPTRREMIFYATRSAQAWLE